MEPLFSGEAENIVDSARMEQELDQLETELQHRKTTPLNLNQRLEFVVNSLNAVCERLWNERY